GKGDDRGVGREIGEREVDVGGGARGAASSARGISGSDESDRVGAAAQKAGFVDENRPEIGAAQRALDIVPAGVYVVIARDHEDTVGRGELTEEIGVDRDIFGTVVDEVARDGDQVGRERVRGADDSCYEATRRVRSDVEVRELRDLEAV